MMMSLYKGSNWLVVFQSAGLVVTEVVTTLHSYWRLQKEQPAMTSSSSWLQRATGTQDARNGTLRDLVSEISCPLWTTAVFPTGRCGLGWSFWCWTPGPSEWE